MPSSEKRKVIIECAIGRIEQTSSDESDLSEDENKVQHLSGSLVKKNPLREISTYKSEKKPEVELNMSNFL